jgi:hypothetical protein
MALGAGRGHRAIEAASLAKAIKVVARSGKAEMKIPIPYPLSLIPFLSLAKLTVYFDRAGSKKFIAKYAKLTRI